MSEAVSINEDEQVAGLLNGASTLINMALPSRPMPESTIPLNYDVQTAIHNDQPYVNSGRLRNVPQGVIVLSLFSPARAESVQVVLRA